MRSAELLEATRAAILERGDGDVPAVLYRLYAQMVVDELAIGVDLNWEIVEAVAAERREAMIGSLLPSCG